MIFLAKVLKKLLRKDFFRRNLLVLMDQVVNDEEGRGEIKKIFRQRYVVYYTEKSRVLSQLCDRFGSDKGTVAFDNHVYNWPAHNYCDYYESLFHNSRFNTRKVFECGIGTNNESINSNMTKNGRPGASLRVWKEFFPNAKIYGADVDKSILFNEDRIYTDFIDQTSVKSIAQYWNNLNVYGFDLMIDDGLHNFSAGKNLFEGSIKYLGDLGVYVIEDVTSQNLLLFKEYFDTQRYFVEYIELFRDVGNSLGDNSLIVIRKNNL
jgi:hypothetical protein